MKYILIDDNTKNGSYCEEEVLNAKTDHEARVMAKMAWEHLSEHDQKERDAFYLLKLTDRDYKIAIDEDDCRWYGDFGDVIWEAK